VKTVTPPITGFLSLPVMVIGNTVPAPSCAALGKKKRSLAFKKTISLQSPSAKAWALHFQVACNRILRPAKVIVTATQLPVSRNLKRQFREKVGVTFPSRTSSPPPLSPASARPASSSSGCPPACLLNFCKFCPSLRICLHFAFVTCPAKSVQCHFFQFLCSARCNAISL